MARTVREATLGTRSARLRLPVQTKPHWRVIEQGLHLGYRRRATGGTWIARRRDEHGIYRETKIGLADDLQDAPGGGVLDFSQAQRAARGWCTNQQRLASGLALPSSGHGALSGSFSLERAAIASKIERCSASSWVAR
jgi:hypothetical protein